MFFLAAQIFFLLGGHVLPPKQKHYLYLYSIETQWFQHSVVTFNLKSAISILFDP